jgi:hypothetical protein
MRSRVRLALPRCWTRIYRQGASRDPVRTPTAELPRDRHRPPAVPPRPSGTLSAIDAAPQADLVIVAHTGLDHLDSRPPSGKASRHVLEVCGTAEEAVRVLRRIPVHMSYNVTALDRSGRWATVRPPLYATRFHEGFGTLYTAEYHPAEGTVSYHWPGRSWRQSLGRFQAGSFQIQLRAS